MTWQELAKAIQIQIRRYPDLETQTAMFDCGTVWYELDLYRAIQSNRMVIGPAFEAKKKEEEHAEDTGSD